MNGKLYRLYLRATEIICTLLLLCVLLCMIIQISCRLLQISQSFTEEVARICFCLFVFLGSPLALAEGVHIVVDMMVRKLGSRGQRWFEVFDSLAVDIFSLFCIRGMVTMLSANKKTMAVSMPWFHMNVVYAFISLSFLFLFLVSTIQLVAAIKGRPLVNDIHAEEKKAEMQAENAVLESVVSQNLGGRK